MQRIIIFLLTLVSVTVLNAQIETRGVKLNLGGAAGTYNQTGSDRVNLNNGNYIKNITFFVGGSFLGLNKTSEDNPFTYGQYDRKFKLGFPWGELFVNKTFSYDRFTVSKGYFADRVELNWSILNNASSITNIEVYRTTDIDSDNPIWGLPIQILSRTASSFIDNTAESGKLYRYKVKAIGVINGDPDSEINNFLVGVGYRNQTGIITGNVSYKGGNPVKDVLVSAMAEGASDQLGSSLLIPADGKIWIPNLNRSLNDSFTVQLWAKYANSISSNPINLFNVYSNSNSSILTSAQFVANGTKLKINIGGSEFFISGFIPNGKLNNRGDDLADPISSFIDRYVHFTVVFKDGRVPLLYINGRPITQSYFTYLNSVLPNGSTATLETNNLNNLNINTNSSGNSITWNSFEIGGGVAGFFDDFRAWSRSLTDQDIRTSYRRYIRGDDNGLISYLRFDENGGKNVYDLSFRSNQFNNNNGRFVSNSSTSGWWSFSTPERDQLGIFGITDVNGNYSISAIPFKGNGELYKITPSLGVHKFDPAQEKLFIGTASSVVNRVNFTDISSFVFRGRVIYDSRGVFPQGPSSDDVTGDIKDNESYNAFVVGSRKYPKGEYWPVYGTGNDSSRIIRLRRYAPIAVDGATVYVDNNMVLDENNNPVYTDANGRFNIQVPIGNHSISVRKNGHIFQFGGRFPARDSALVNGVWTFTNTFKEFFEDSDEETTFLDNTRITLVGRVVGGNIESSKPIGFGHNGAYTITPAAKYGLNNSSVNVSSINNIGTASITLGYRSPGANSITNEFKTTFSTNSVTGEYKVDLLPLRYELNRSDVFIASQNTESKRRFLSESLNLNYTEIPAYRRDAFILADTLNRKDTLARSIPYQYQKDFIYTALPEIAIIRQEHDTTIVIGDSTYKLATNALPLYTQQEAYSIIFQRQEKYYNYEKALANQLNIVPATDGDFVITNNLALPGSESLVTDSSNTSLSIYKFLAGQVNANINSGFVKSISALYRLNGTDYPISGLKTSGIILGGASDGSTGFITQGPDQVDMILRDPPGSSSSATIQKGSTFSIESKNAGIIESSTQMDVTIKLGMKFMLGGGIAGPGIETNVENKAGARFLAKVNSTNGKSLTTTYTFSDAISTSSSPDVVGSKGDIYIGKSSNYYYGLYDELKGSNSATTDRNNNLTSIPINTTRGIKYITKKKALSFTPDGTPTFFMYSQDYVLNQLIPSYEDILDKLRKGLLSSGGTSNIKDSVFYKESLRLWKEAIVRNEAQKYKAYMMRDDLKSSIKESILRSYRDVSGATLTKAGNRLKQILDEAFYRNLSIDASVGSFVGKTTVESATSWTTSFSLGLGFGALMEAGFEVGGTGFEIEVENENMVSYAYEQNEKAGTTQEISYTISDTDPLNVLSVDVVNSFDGNGPVFILRGGASSCPVESSEKSKFFTTDVLKAIDADTLSKIKLVNLDESKRVELSKGSIPLEKPELSVARSSVSGVPETGRAEFIFTLSNSSQLEPVSSSFKLKLNPASNPNGARLNIDANGVPITLNGSRAIQYTVFVEKGAANVFNYDSLEVVLESSCDGSVRKSVFISARFIQSCTKVEIARPANNFVINTSNAYNNGLSVPIPILLNGYRVDYSGFNRIVLQYRQQGTPSWTLLKNYVKDQAARNLMISQGGDSATIEIINGTELNYAWDIAGTSLADGNYEIRAVSYCNNGTLFETSPILVKVDLVTPILFGTPSPTDGILSIGEDIKLRFSENVKKNGTLTRVDFVVQDNQLPVDHSVALSFAGNSTFATISSPFIKAGDISIEFWLKNASTSNSVILSQSNGFAVSVSNSAMSFSIGNNVISSNIATDGLYHHYVATYNKSTGKMTLIQDDVVLKSEVKATNLITNNNADIKIGGSNFIGKLHDLRIWSTVVSRETAVANMYAILRGNEDGLIGYWPMSEGNGRLAKDLARSKHLVLTNIDWDIFPNTQSYAFNGSSYLALTNASRSIFSSTMDGTISFWMKTNTRGPSTLISNGKGDLTDPLTTSGYRNKWSIDLDNSGVLNLKAEGRSFAFGTKNLADGLWHHVAVVLKRKGNMIFYVDGSSIQEHPVTGLGGFSASTLFVGARGQISGSNQTTIDQYFTGQLDDLCIWNLAKQSDQIAEDMFYEQNYNSTGLVLYAPFNQPSQSTSNGPKYWVPLDAQNKTSDNAILSAGSTLSYSNITPPIKPIRNTINIPANAIVNGDEVLIDPSITDWATIEKKIVYITVANMFDLSDNRQLSPITWTAFINRNPLKWYIEGFDNNLNTTLEQGKTDTYQLVIANVSGNFANFSFELPSFLVARTTSGTISPNSQIKIPISVNTSLSPGKYFDILKLKSSYRYDEQIQVNVRVLTPEPLWDFDPNKYEDNMNIVGKLRINGVFSKDTNSKVIAYHLDTVKGIAPLVYDDKYDSYYVLMNVYGNPENSGDEINFKIWDANDGILKAATINNLDSIIFQPNLLIGNYQNPIIFENSNRQTQILSLNQGWTWVSFNVNDKRFAKLDTLFRTLVKSRGDLIKSYNPTFFDVYNVSSIPGQTGWFGTLSLNGGIDTLKSYRIKLGTSQKILLSGTPISLNSVFNLSSNWNNLPYIASRNLRVKDALSGFDAADGDQIKSQTQFAIFDGISNSWKGNLTHMIVGQGYMIKASRSQQFSYPSYANNVTINQIGGIIKDSSTIKIGLDTQSDEIYPDKELINDKEANVSSSKLDPSLLGFSETMNVVAELPIGYDNVQFVANGKQVSYSQKVRIDNKDLYFVTLFGDALVNIKPILFDGLKKVETTNNISFVPNATLGSLKAPYSFKLVEPLNDVLKVYPNPFTSEFNIEFSSLSNGFANLQIYDIASKLIESKQISVIKGINRHRIVTSALPANAYTIKVTNGDKVFTKVIVKQ